MKEYLRAVCLCAAIVVVVLFATGMVWYGYLVTAALFGLTRGETATAALGIALVAGAVKAYREQRRQGVRREAIERRSNCGRPLWQNSGMKCRRRSGGACSRSTS